MTEAIKNLIVDGVEHAIDTFSPEIQNLIALRQVWADELVKERNAVVKTEAAIRQLDAELSGLVQAHLNKDNVPADAPADAPANDEQA